jgi:type II secretory pathway pseudopilin PulG
MKKTFKRKSYGVTLIELTVAMTIFLMIGYLVLSSTLTSRTTSAVTQAAIYLNSQALQASSSITRELMEADLTSVTVDDAYIDAGVTLYRRIRFQIPVLNANGDLVAGAGGSTAFGDGQTEGNSLRYALVSTNLERQVLDSAGNTINTSIIARNLQANTGFRTPDISSSAQYDVTLSFSISSYQGITLPAPLTQEITVTASPKN